jgi:phage tail tape-measure protein
MARPTKEEKDRRVRVVTAKLTAAEAVAWDALRTTLGGIVPARDTDALRHVMEQACVASGAGWPSAAASPLPARKRPKRGAKR